ncbi:methyltransferase domain-containing protein [Corynebacterium poyangense]|uniref:Methyltransferase domain-containing protein n=1 Tax=Corynebacterium poyangense TaxID=2684405 RepID=A0A7H0SSC6_9CORY|nr:methyltransferase domain-containing protein [Corynebacterium poyangense]QNQ91451.1 methyltransferase domain-containing protein [Corynebacterium poyangense]
MFEFGIGTGRIARPLSNQGYSVKGVDNSREMLDRLNEKSDARSESPPV